MRRPDWPERMAGAIEAARGKAFAWGNHDCCLFAADVALAMTGIDHGAAFRGHYSTAAGAARALKKYGGGSIVATATALLGEPQPPLMAQRGDMVLAETELGPALGLCLGAVAVFAAPAGLATLPLAACTHAWRVG